MRCKLIVSICNVWVYVKLILSFLPVILSTLGFFLQVPVNNFFFSLFFCSSVFFSRFDILMTGRKVYYAMTLDVYVYIYIYSLIPFFLSFFFVCFGSHGTISIVRVRMTLTGGRRFFLLQFFFSDKVHLFSTFFFFFSLSLPLVLLR